MPTTAKLVAALFFAAIGWFAANAHIPALGEQAYFGRFREITALIGLLVGWYTMGSLVGQSYADAVGSGLRTSVTLVFFALLIFATYLMYGQTQKMIFDGPLEAALGVFENMLDQGRKMLTPGVLGVLIIGGAVGGMLTEWTARRWR
ncbi:TrgA family protein [Xinfangfangia sp. CPCC 101601]|uniref:TrgA family protein n=1 Tax=Pseudogemmobacter lacusdianii TaxID=3069608 RepID=A0ABU0VTM6_9RHOB|nr:TrgA family protein [Xinfangfangia sp. CPCC 101601]MDQ2065064.1 TrgA family protein [Xinfangfangia sp. CPCC 101601]